MMKSATDGADHILDAAIGVALGMVAEALADIEVDGDRRGEVGIARRVGAGAAVQRIGAEAADQDIVAAAAGDDVAERVAGQGLGDEATYR